MTGSTLMREGGTFVEDFAFDGVVEGGSAGAPIIAINDLDGRLTAADVYPELRGLKLRCTLAFFPTRYAVGQPLNPPYDEVPLYAQKAIDAAAESGMFDYIEVRTPERTRDERMIDRALERTLDPIAIGVIEDRYYPIVRWGVELPTPLQLLWRGSLRGIRRNLLRSLPRHA